MAEIPDRDYLEYLRGVGSWTPEQELLWSYLSYIADRLTQLTEQKEPERNTPNLIGQYKIQPQGDGKGSRKGPPPIII